ncbi:glycosyltransferase family 2 protein [Providencia hangzhouensis]|uniref:glycosyltransferase family 2 protein n=1 Tax=Providencia TaxID=586 RepID=UPI001EF649C3|nr:MULTISPECIES: glycosyltransferase family 2 protein [Providencia]MDB9566422.1 glycosyltransferase family 2 protein [Providencia rettgeri]MDL9985410.1 glycosyltransferase family 2 protein [Providencia rettgeri]WIE08193.1 glycosyltransferase family 2 protein [Providencia rettgeri]WOB90939.1 glycosyltransferase family 2 protein [Providencia sp. PROV175]CAB5583674.1 Hyaluronan synthase [Providencia rettgeri]
MSEIVTQELVSIIMPCYNAEQYIKDSINSVLNQTYPHFELIIIDDLSTDNSINIINSFSDNRIKLIQLTQNGGAGVARNTGIEAAQGRFIAFLDSDDLWRPNKLEVQLSHMIEGNYPLSYTQYQKFTQEGKGKLVIPPNTVTYNELLYCNIIGCLTAVYDTKILGKQFMPLIRKRQDMGLWLKILAQGHTAYCCPQVLADYRTDSGMTQNKIDAAKYQWKFYRQELSFNIIKSTKYFIGYAIKGIIRK